VSDRTLPPTTGWFLGDYSGTTYTDVGFLSSWADTRTDAGDTYAAWWNNGDSLAITCPNGGEAFAVQQPCTVRWHYRYAPDSMLVELNRYYPAGAWETLATVRSDSANFVWFPTNPETATARLRIVGQHHPTVGDTSDGDFMIGMRTPGRVTAYCVGSDIRLRWDGTGAAYFRIYGAASADGPFDTLEGTVTTNVFLDVGAAVEPLKFYVVTASSAP